MLDLSLELPDNHYALHLANYATISEPVTVGVEVTSVSALSYCRYMKSGYVPRVLEQVVISDQFPMTASFRHGSELSIEYMCLRRLTDTVRGLYYYFFTDLVYVHKERYLKEAVLYFRQCQNRISELIRESRGEDYVAPDPALAPDPTAPAAPTEEEELDEIERKEREEFYVDNYNYEEYRGKHVGQLNIAFYFDMDCYMSSIEIYLFDRWNRETRHGYEYHERNEGSELRRLMHDYERTMSLEFLEGEVSNFYFNLVYSTGQKRLYKRKFPFVLDPDKLSRSVVMRNMATDTALVNTNNFKKSANHKWIYWSCLYVLYCKSQRYLGVKGNEEYDFDTYWRGNEMEYEYPAIVLEPVKMCFVAMKSVEEGKYCRDALDAIEYLTHK